MFPRPRNNTSHRQCPARQVHHRKEDTSRSAGLHVRHGQDTHFNNIYQKKATPANGSAPAWRSAGATGSAASACVAARMSSQSRSCCRTNASRDAARRSTGSCKCTNTEFQDCWWKGWDFQLSARMSLPSHPSRDGKMVNARLAMLPATVLGPAVAQVGTSEQVAE